MLVESTNRTVNDGVLAPEDFEPNQESDHRSLFRNIGLAGEFGSGVRNLNRYGWLYSGQTP